MSRRPAPRYDDLLCWRARFAKRHATWVSASAVVVAACGWFDPSVLAFGGVPMTFAALMLAHDRRDLGLSHGERSARGGGVVRIAKGGLLLSRGVGVLGPADAALELTGTRRDPLPRVMQLLTIVGGLLAMAAFDMHTAAVFVVASFALSALILAFAERETVVIHADTVRHLSLDGVELRFELLNVAGRFDPLVLILHGLDTTRVQGWLRDALGEDLRLGPERAPAGSGTLREAEQLADQHDRLRGLRDAGAPT